MTGNARNLRRWPRSTIVSRPTIIFNPQGNVSVLTTAGSHNAGSHGHYSTATVRTTAGSSNAALAAHNISVAVATFQAAIDRAVVVHSAFLESVITYGAAYTVLFREPSSAVFVQSLTTSGSGVTSSTQRAATPDVVVSAASSVVAVILARDIATASSITAGSSSASAVLHHASIENVLSTFGAYIQASISGSTSLQVSTDIGVSTSAQSLKAALLSALSLTGVSTDSVNDRTTEVGAYVSIAVIPVTNSSHNAPITVAVLNTMAASADVFEVEHNTVPLAVVVTMGSDAPAITSTEAFIEVLTSAGVDTRTALHLALNPILILRTSVGGTSMIQLGSEKMVEIQETQPGVTADV